MLRFLKFNLVCGLLAGFILAAPSQGVAQVAGSSGAKSVALIRKVSLLNVGNNVELEILASAPVTPQSQVVAAPNRLVIDFPNAQPGSELHSLNVNRGDVKNVRVGLFSTNPPVTRVVLDLTAMATYHIYPSGKTVIIKFDAKLDAKSNATIGGSGHLQTVSSLSSSSSSSSAAAPVIISEDDMPLTLPVRPKARVDVHFNRGMLSIHVDQGTLAEVLNEVHRQTGADIPIPPGAQQESIVADIGPVPARDAMAALLNGSHFNFVIVGSERDPNELRSVLLTSKQGGASMAAGGDVAQEYSATNQPPPEPVQGQVMQPSEPVDDTPPPAPETEPEPPPQPQ
jgi:hypothetical protein